MAQHVFRSVVLIAVEADTPHEAEQIAEETAAEIESSLPFDCRLIQKNGHAEVCFVS